MEDGLPLISIGIPIYNCEKYIEQCTISLFEQTYPNIEYVFVDDCSTDRSIELLQNIIARYPHRIPYIKLIKHNINCGSWKARNTCLENITGEYLTFCDADDWIEKEGIELMCNCIIKEQMADVICTPLFINKELSQEIVSYGASTLCNLNTIPNDVLHFGLTTKLFRRSLFVENNIKVYHDINCWDDLCITARIFAITDKVKLLNIPFYHYRKDRQPSITLLDHKKILSQHIECANLLTEWFKQQALDKKYAHFINYLQFTSKIKILRGREKEVGKWKNTFPESNKHIMKYRNIPLYYRILFQLVNILPTFISQTIANLSTFYHSERHFSE